MPRQRIDPTGLPIPDGPQPVEVESIAPVSAVIHPDSAERAAQLEAEAAEIRRRAAARQAELEERAVTRERALIACGQVEEEQLRPELDAILAELRAALPGSDTWAPRMRAALSRYERATREHRHAERMAEHQYKQEAALARHPIARLRPLIEWLAGD